MFNLYRFPMLDGITFYIGIHIFPKVNIKLFMVNAKEDEIEFTLKALEQLSLINLEFDDEVHYFTKPNTVVSHLDNGIKLERTLVSLCFQGYKLSQGCIKMVMWPETVQLLQEFYSIAKRYTDQLNNKFSEIEKAIEKMLPFIAMIQKTWLGRKF